MRIYTPKRVLRRRRRLWLLLVLVAVLVMLVKVEVEEWQGVVTALQWLRPQGGYRTLPVKTEVVEVEEGEVEVEGVVWVPS
jgi:hypothetical protein